MNIENEKVKKVIRYLQKLEEDYGYRTVEVANLINNFHLEEDEEVTDDMIQEVNNVCNGVDDIFDEYVRNKCYDICNKGEE